MKKITPCLWFDNDAEEAVDFYLSVFEDAKKLSVTHYTEVGPGPKGAVLTVRFELLGQEFLALNAGPQFQFNEAVSFMVNCQTQAEIDDYWEKLTAGGGKEIECGWLKDKFGLAWQIVPAIFEELLLSDPKKADNVMRAMMQMKKLDIAKLQQAADEA